jgi:hypothetical protein
MEAARDARTTGQRWRRRRNLVIALAHASGASQRLLAEVFDLPRSSIHEILVSLRAEGEAISDHLARSKGPIRARPFRSDRTIKSGHPKIRED